MAGQKREPRWKKQWVVILSGEKNRRLRSKNQKAAQGAFAWREGGGKISEEIPGTTARWKEAGSKGGAQMAIYRIDRKIRTLLYGGGEHALGEQREVEKTKKPKTEANRRGL